MGLLFWIFKEGARSESPAHYWFWFSGGPYIRNAKGRVEHIVFKSKVLSVCGVPILGFGVKFYPTTNQYCAVTKGDNALAFVT
jgi:hypothetical protein